MIASDDHFFRQAGEKRILILNRDLAGFAVHQGFCMYGFSAESFTDGLMPQADAKNWNGPAEFLDNGDGNTGACRVTGTGGDDNCLRSKRLDFFQRDFIVSFHHNVRIKFANILIEVIRKRIVVVDH